MRPLDAALAHPAVRALADALALRPGAVATVAPHDPTPRRAAVAAVLRVAPGDADPSLLFVRRAEYPGDPWSGHVAFPGGRAELGDATPWDTAARETWEETGLDLRRDAHVLGALDELYPRTPTLPPIIVRPYVAVTGAAAPLHLSAELAAAFWVPLPELRDPAADRISTVVVRGRPIAVPSLVYGAHTIWGMTERVVRQLLTLLG
ncbi:MAG TPA: CoA pyrophosphatase [Gemmatirosa sp.]